MDISPDGNTISFKNIDAKGGLSGLNGTRAEKQ